MPPFSDGLKEPPHTQSITMKKLLLIGAILMQPVYGAKLPASVDSELQELARFCRLLGGRPHGFQQAVERADLNGDGITDYVLDDSELQCYGASGSVGMFGNRNGGGVTVFLGRADGKAEKSIFITARSVQKSIMSANRRNFTSAWRVHTAAKRPKAKKRDGYEKCSRPLKWNDKSRRFQIDMQTKRTALHWW